MLIKDISSDSVTIGWNKPLDDGGLDISAYQVERCNVGKMIWSKVADVEHDLSAYSIQKLHEDAEYMFRVCAQNAVGVSEFLESEPVTVKCRYREYTPGRLIPDPLTISFGRRGQTDIMNPTAVRSSALNSVRVFSNDTIRYLRSTRTRTKL